MTAEKKKLPGCGLRMLSFVPMVNWAALVILGVGWGRMWDTILGVLYGVITFVFPDWAPWLWIAGMVHYALSCRSVKKTPASPPAQPADFQKPEPISRADIRLPEPKALYTPVVLPGEPEKKESIPIRTPAVSIPVSKIEEKRNHRPLSAEERFYRDMKLYADRAVTEAALVPFGDERPIYESMSKYQKAWYFYWRSQVRGGIYPETDVGYILLYSFELLNGQDWQTPGEGLRKLQELWLAYRLRHGELDGKLYPWCLDFARKHDLPMPAPEVRNLAIPDEPVLRDLMIEAYSQGKPLKLPFALVDGLCAYSLTGSKFYKDSHQALMEEAIPRVIALADAALIKEKKKGLLAVYGPARPKKQMHYPFRGAICPDGGQQIEISLRGYTAGIKLREYINSLVRHGENVLRSICGYRGRLRGVELEPELAALVESFLRREYGAKDKPAGAQPEKKALKLDFDNIAQLRAQSDEVRDALEVSQEQPDQKEDLTDLQAVTELIQALSEDEEVLMARLCLRGWEMPYNADMGAQVAGINAKALRLLACALLVREGNMLLAEDDYRDELTQIYALKKAGKIPEKQKKPEEKGIFDVSKLPESLAELVNALSPLHQKALAIVVGQTDVADRLAALAEEAMTMPEILIDEINDQAAAFLDDILIDGLADVPCVLEQYAQELQKAML